MTLKFKPEDFEYNAKDLGEEGKYLRVGYAVNIAQRIFNNWLSEQPVVYGPHMGNKWDRNLVKDRDAMQARLVCIEEVKKCEHPPNKIKHLEARLHGNYTDKILYTEFFECECGAKVKPNSFSECE